MKSKYPYILILLIIIGVFGIACYTAYQAIPRIHYASYYEKNYSYDLERTKIQKELEELYDDYDHDQFSKKEFEEKVNQIKREFLLLKSNREKLKKEYEVTDSLDLDTVKMDKNKDRDISLKNLYYRKTDVEKQQESLDLEEEELEKEYFEGELSKSELLKIRKDIEIREHLLALEEEKLKEDAKNLGILNLD